MRFFLLLFCLALLLGCQSSSAWSSPENVTGFSVNTKKKVVSEESIQEAIDRGIRFLLANQNKNGSWGTALNVSGMESYSPMPGSHYSYQAAVTGLAAFALSEHEKKHLAITHALDACEIWMKEKLPRVQRVTTDVLYNIWGHAYAVRALVQLRKRHDPTSEKYHMLTRLVEDQLNQIKRFEYLEGGWGYYDFVAQTRRVGDDANSFTTGTVLLALKDCKDAGFEVDKELVERALNAVNRQRKPDFTYFYSSNHRLYPFGGINRPGGSLGRTQVCNCALYRWEDEALSLDILDEHLTRLVRMNAWLEAGRKRPIPHESYLAVAGYFFYYAYFYAGQCLELLDKDSQAKHQQLIANILLPLQEKDGSWWDYPLYDYHKFAGTPMALMTLTRCLQE